MPDVIEEQKSAADSKGVEGATDQTGDSAADSKGVEMSEKEKGMLAAKEAETKKRQEAEQRAEAAEEQVRIQNQQIQTYLRNQNVPTEEAKDIFEQQGLEDYESPTVAQIRQYARQAQQQGITTQKQINLQNFIGSHPDFQKKVGQIMNGQIVPSQALQEALKAEPSMQMVLTDPMTAPIIAYQLVQSYETQQKVEEQIAASKEKEVQQKVDNKTNPVSPAAVTGGGAATDLASQISDMTNPAHLAKLQTVVKDMLEGKYD